MEQITLYPGHMDNNRLKHSIAVARKMVAIAKKYNLSQEEMTNCFIIGINHDIGYEFSKNGIEHNKIGGILLKETGFKYWREVYYHGESECDYESMYLMILNMADMQIDNLGNDIGFEGRLENIRVRYGDDSIVYKKCVGLIDKLRDSNKLQDLIEKEKCNKRLEEKELKKI